MPSHLPHFSVLSFSEKTLFKSLSNDHVDPTDLREQKRATYLFRYLTDIKAQTIVVEFEYTDADYLDDFASYYVKCFRAYDRRCKRIHFFSASVTRNGFKKAIIGDQSAAKVLQESYLGFVVARPLPKAVLGRTVLKCYERDGGRRNYTCVKEYSANLFGIDLRVSSLAYQEQDNVTAMCATVALWCCFQKTAAMFGTATPRPATITRIANQVVGESRSFPSGGLNVQQMCNAISKVGLDPEVIRVSKDVPLPSLLYAYLKMGLPVMLVVDIEQEDLHAITLAGYSLRDTVVHQSEAGSGGPLLRMTGLRIDEFYAHDDQIGPFSRVIVKPSKKYKKVIYPVVFEGSWFDPKSNELLTIYPEAVIVPVYSKIRLTFFDAYEWVARFNQFFSNNIVASDSGLEWDIHLITTNDYKRLRKGSSKYVSKELLEDMLVHQYPRFLWRAVLMWNQEVEVVEILMDATDIKKSFPIVRVNCFHALVRKTIIGFLREPKMKGQFEAILTKPFISLMLKHLK